MLRETALRWKKKTDGSIVSVHRDDVFRIYSKPEPTWGLFDVHYLTKDGKVLYAAAPTNFSTGKEECKKVARRLAAGARPVLPGVLAAITDEFPWDSETACRQWISHHTWGWYTNHAGIPRMPRDEGQAFKDYFRIANLPALLTQQRKEKKKAALEAKKKKKPGVAKPTEAAKPIAEVPAEQYNGKLPRIRSGEGLKRMIRCTEKYPKKLKLENAKFKSIRVWAESIRDYFEERGQFITVSCLRSFILERELDSYVRKDKAVCRLNLIFDNEVNGERAHVDYMIREANKPPEVKEKKEKDKFGNKIGSTAAKINAVLSENFRTMGFLMKAAKITTPVHGHLKDLVKRGLVIKRVKRINGKKRAKYALAPEPEQAEPKKVSNKSRKGKKGLRRSKTKKR